MSRRVTPMVTQYEAIKAKHRDDILLFRLGDFYEMFGEDAVKASQVLDITLTSREFGKGERIPMCGVPHHAAEAYIAALVSKGFRVAVCDQLEDPRHAKGVVERGVTRIVTPGTVTLPQALEAKAHRLLAAVCRHQRAIGLAALDASTGEFWATQLEGKDAPSRLAEELIRLQPAELLAGPGCQALAETFPEGPSVLDYDERAFHPDGAYRLLTRHFRTESLHSFGIEDRPAAVRAAGAALAYLAETQRTSLAHVTRLVSYQVGEYMGLDETTRRNLELSARLRDGHVEGSLLWVLDRTVTGMGGRLLRTWVDQPLLRRDAIAARSDAVAHLVYRPDLRAHLRELLAGIFDIERLLGRVATQSANARDLQSLARSLQRVPLLQEALHLSIDGEASSAPKALADLAARLDGVPDVTDAIERALLDELPVGVREGGLIRDGYDERVDELRAIRRSGQQWIAAMEEEERERTGIRSLKIGYNKVFGYYIEVTRANLDRVPPEYERRQTLSGAERFITPKLKEQEARVLGAAERLVELEYDLFVELRSRVTAEIHRLQPTARAVAELDALASLAEAAAEHGYVQPELLEPGGPIIIKGGRHPAVELTHKERGFVANDTELAQDGTRLMVLTGPNMAGKSTYLRQVALIVLMAQIGSFVPAAEARIGLVDRIFTRIGAGDDLGSGRSTFMVEMHETAHILHHATPQSLVLLDELGRGTSTYDGMALAQAVAEHLHDAVQAKTILSTHYHELTRLEEMLPHAANFHAAVQEDKGRVSFLYRIVPGFTDRSYGVNVARMAGLPGSVVQRANRLLRRYEGAASQWWRDNPPGQLSLWESATSDEAGPDPSVRRNGFDAGAPWAAELAAREAAATEDDDALAELAEELSHMSVNDTTPLQALQWIEKWQRRLHPRSG